MPKQLHYSTVLWYPFTDEYLPYKILELHEVNGRLRTEKFILSNSDGSDMKTTTMTRANRIWRDESGENIIKEEHPWILDSNIEGAAWWCGLPETPKL